MRGILYLLPLCLFCLGWVSGPVSHFSFDHAPRSSKGATGHPSQSPSGTAAPSPDVSGPASPALPGSTQGGVLADWQVFDDARLGLTIFSPPEWHFVEDVQAWTLSDGMAEPARAALTGLLMQLQSAGQPDSLIGAGYVSPQQYTDLLHVNQFAVEIFPRERVDVVPVRLGRGPRSWGGRPASTWTASNWSPDCGQTGKRRFRSGFGEASPRDRFRGRC